MRKLRKIAICLLIISLGMGIGTIYGLFQMYMFGMPVVFSVGIAIVLVTVYLNLFTTIAVSRRIRCIVTLIACISVLISEIGIQYGISFYNTLQAYPEMTVEQCRFLVNEYLISETGHKGLWGFYLYDLANKQVEFIINGVAVSSTYDYGDSQFPQRLLDLVEKGFILLIPTCAMLVARIDLVMRIKH